MAPPFVFSVTHWTFANLFFLMKIPNFKVQMANKCQNPNPKFNTVMFDCLVNQLNYYVYRQLRQAVHYKYKYIYDNEHF